MTIREFCKKYNLHDSLLEQIEICSDNKTAKLTVDFCYWQQNGYDDSEQETGIVFIVFSDLINISYDNHPLNSDEIISCEVDKDGNMIMQLESDITRSYHTLMISSKNVEMIETP